MLNFAHIVMMTLTDDVIFITLSKHGEKQINENIA